MFIKSPRNRLAVTVFALVLLSAAPAFSFPGKMSYQGRLTDNVGDPLNGSFSITFSIYSDPGPGPSIALWTENHAAVTVTDGLFSVELGTTLPLVSSVFGGSTR